MSIDFEDACQLAFADPGSEPGSPCAVLHFLRRGVGHSLSSGPDLWSAAFGLLGGIDHLSRLRYGEVTPAWRFRHTLWQNLQLDAKEVGAVGRLCDMAWGWQQPYGAARIELTDHGPTSGESINVPALHQRFEGAVSAYRHDLAVDDGLQKLFLRTFCRWGTVTVHGAVVPGSSPRDGLSRYSGPVPGVERIAGLRECAAFS